jgi:hypothetical protein
MATVKIKLSQNVIDQQHNTTPLNSSLAGMVDRFEQAGYDIDADYSHFSSWSLVGSTLRLTYPDGATETYTGVVLDNPNVDQGHASAAGFEFHQDGLLTLTASGKLNYDYAITGTDLAFGTSASGSNFTSLGVATQLPAASPNYDPVFGNISLVVNGNVNLSPTDDLTGTISRITVSAEKFLVSDTIEGRFQIGPNWLANSPGQPESIVEGVLTGYSEAYQDGSQVSISDISAYINAGQSLDAQSLLNGYHLPGNDDISVELPGHLYGDFVVASGDGNDRISIKGGGGHLAVSAGSGNDRITILGDSHNVNGGLGIDTVVLPSTHADYVLRLIPPSTPDPRYQDIFFNVTDKAGVVNTLGNVERIQFSDVTVAIDIDGNAGQAYRLYQAAFNRTPDSVGLGFWIDVLDNGTNLTSVAQGFVNSNEFRTAYGASQTNRELVTQFYQNILHRAPETGGLDFWTGVLDTKAAGVADVLAAISESGENKAGLIGVIGNGFEFTPYVHG